MSKLPEIGKRYKLDDRFEDKSTWKVIRLYLRHHPTEEWAVLENEANKEVGKQVKSSEILWEFEELPDQEPIKEHVKNLYTKEEHVKKSEKSLHEGSIWKPIAV